MPACAASSTSRASSHRFPVSYRPRTVTDAAGDQTMRDARRFGSVDGHDAGELVARVDVELSIDLAEVVFDGAGADEEPGADRGVGRAARCHSRDLPLLRSEVEAGV